MKKQKKSKFLLPVIIVLFCVLVIGIYIVITRIMNNPSDKNDVNVEPTAEESVEILGCVTHLGQFMYFDKDGIVRECKNEKDEEVPLISGLEFQYVVMDEKLPVDNEELFNNIVQLTTQLEKYSLVPDKIMYDKDLEVTLYMGDARVNLGGSDNLNDKIYNLSCIKEKLQGLKGVLHMENFSEDSQNITFETE